MPIRGIFSWRDCPSEMKEEVPHLLHGIEEGSRRIQRIVKDLKEYSRRDREILEDSISINDVVQKSLTLLNPMLKKAQNIHVRLSENLPNIKGNRQKLEQVVINLVQNACQAVQADNQSIQITTALDEENRDILIVVQDQGIGIPEDVLPHIMDPFFTTKRDTGGTGLGLAVSSNIIKEHGGKIEVQSQVGKGSTFTTHLPVLEKVSLKKIMVVDDDKDIRQLITRALMKKGEYLVRQAGSGTEASVRLGIERPNLVILDMQMPDMNGVEICRLIKTREELTGMKVMIITGFPQSLKVKEANDLGFTHVLPKPFNIPTILAMVEDILKEK